MVVLRRPDGYWRLKNPKLDDLSCMISNCCMSQWKLLCCEKNFVRCLQNQNWPKLVDEKKNWDITNKEINQKISADRWQIYE